MATPVSNTANTVGLGLPSLSSPGLTFPSIRQSIQGEASECVSEGVAGCLGISFQLRLKAVICDECQLVIKPSNIIQHLKKCSMKGVGFDNVGKLKDIKKALEALVVKYSIPSEVPQTPSHGSIAFAGLKIVNAHQCQNAKCGFIAGARSTQQQHAWEPEFRAFHTNGHVKWNPVKAQHFGHNCRYFAVVPPVNIATPFSTYARLHLQEEAAPIRAPLSETHDRDATPLLNHTGWHILLKDYVSDLGLREKLMKWSAPAKVGDGSGLDFLPDLVESYFMDTNKSADEVDIKVLEPFANVPV